MDLYLPVAEMSVNALGIMGLGLVAGFLSGLFGIGGGFLTTPILIFTGIPPAIAVASSAPQVTGSSVAAAWFQFRRRAIDLQMGAVLVGGGLIGAVAGSTLFSWLRAAGQVDVVIRLVYVLFLVSIGGLMVRDGLGAVLRVRRGLAAYTRGRRHHPLVAPLPLRMRFPASRLYVSMLAPLLAGALVGLMTVLMGIGGGFILVPMLLYLVGMPAALVVGTSLFQIVFVTAAATVLHASQSQTVDIILAGLLLVGGVAGAPLGARVAQGLPPERLRLALGLLVVAVGLRLAYDLTIQPAELFVVENPA